MTTFFIVLKTLINIGLVGSTIALFCIVSPPLATLVVCLYLANNIVEYVLFQERQKAVEALIKEFSKGLDSDKPGNA